MPTPVIPRRMLLVGAVVLAALMLGPPQPGRAATAGPQSGYGRIWIYRLYEPYVTLARPYVRLNGEIAGISDPGGAFYRDVPPGTYRVTVDSQGEDVNQFATIGVAAGQTVYVKVDANNWWASINPGTEVDTFYTRPVPAPLAQTEMAGMPGYGGG